MSPEFPIFRFMALSSLCLGVGYVLLKTVVPDEEKAYQALSPERRKFVDESRAKRAAWEAEMKKQVFAQRQNGPMKPIWEEGSNTPKPPPL
ncbi:hypothetical protein DL96DRAFT_444751 [Flagelloscypha sp. PMI_526]|nr:hypothetical protein DL96DRAFT_444751 [Flagelloscypha sp. PMI_526]